MDDAPTSGLVCIILVLVKLLWKNFCRTHSEARHYTHFDYPCSLKSKKIRDYVCDPQKIASHSFYPFIHKEQIKRRLNFKGQTPEVLPPKIRHIRYCSHLDRCVFQRYAYLLGKRYDLFVKQKNFNEVAIAYRKLHKCNVEFAQEAMDFIEKSSPCLVFISDFCDFFDRIDHRILKDRLREICLPNFPDQKSLPNDIYAIFKNITRYSSIDQKKIQLILEKKLTIKNKHPRCLLEEFDFSEFKPFVSKNKNSFGIPQGSPISATLSNIYMLKFDRSLNNVVKKLNGKYLRYSDDILIIIPAGSIKEAAQHQRLIFSFFKKNQNIAKISKKKTRSLYFSDQTFVPLNLDQNKNRPKTFLDYLGFRFTGKIRRIKPASSDRYLHKSRRSAIAAGKQIGRCKIKGQPLFHIKNLYDRYSTCSLKFRKSHPTQKNRSKSNYLTYLRKAYSKGALIQDKTSENILNHSKDRLAKFIRLGTHKVITKKRKARINLVI